MTTPYIDVRFPWKEVAYVDGRIAGDAWKKVG